MRLLRAALLAMFAAIVAAACGSGAPNAPDAPLDATIVLGVGETKPVANSTLRLRFVGVLGDNRCPGDALCIQGGDAIVRIGVAADGSAESSYDLHTGSLEPARHGDVTIALKDLSPYPFVSNPIDPRSYRATLRLTR